MIKPPPPTTTSLYCLSWRSTKDMADSDRHTLAAIYIQGGIVEREKNAAAKWSKDSS